MQRLARPIEFASRDSYAHLANVKSLGPFISNQVLEALADEVYPPSVETDLLALRTLFGDFDESADAAERRRRVAEAHAILERLGSPDAFAQAPTAGHAPEDLWNLPIQYVKG
ncbi:MAG: hypothetical protein ACREI9_09035, partial [Nitrospiraceae bacterium]